MAEAVGMKMRKVRKTKKEEKMESTDLNFRMWEVNFWEQSGLNCDG